MQVSRQRYVRPIQKHQIGTKISASLVLRRPQPLNSGIPTWQPQSASFKNHVHQQIQKWQKIDVWPIPMPTPNQKNYNSMKKQTFTCFLKLSDFDWQSFAKYLSKTQFSIKIVKFQKSFSCFVLILTFLRDSIKQNHETF